MSFINKTFLKLVLLALMTVAFPVTLDAEESNESNHPKVSAFERFRDSDDVSEIQRGLLLLNEMNCVACHKSDSKFWAGVSRKAPILTSVGRRIQHSYLKDFIESPHAAKPGTTMPNVLAEKTVAERELISDSIAHYLAATGQAIHQPTIPAAIRKGKELFHTVGCVACHDPQSEKTSYSTSIPLGKLDKKYTLPGLVSFISNPIHVRPSGRMPQFDLSVDDYQAIASYLLRDLKISASFRYEFYEGDWKKLPDFDSLKSVKTGIAKSFELGNYPKKNGFGIVFTGYLQIADPGEYKFKTSSDDGSRILVNGIKVAEIDGIHPVQSDEGVIELQPGFHKVRIEYFEGAGGEKLECLVSGPGFSNTLLSSVLTLNPVPDPSRIASIKPIEAKVAKGRVYFGKVGCANCHELADAQRLSQEFSKSKALANLKSDKGCLTSLDGPVDFRFDEQQANEISKAIDWLSRNEDQLAKTDPNDRVHQQLMSMNCYSCHSRETGTRGEEDFRIFGGVVDATGGDSLEVFGRDKWFVGTEAEMGDEGRHPPYLKSVGAKLNEKWFRFVLENGPKDRPYVKTMMPKFGIQNMPGLIDDFRMADKLGETIRPNRTTSSIELKDHGRFFVGAEGLSCIKCHTFASFHSTGIPAISLTTMTKRLNKDWFQAYMRKPSNFRRGTRMPESWPDGKSFFPDRLAGDADAQIDAIWEYLSDGEKAKQPKGLKKTKMEIVADAAPRIYRNFIEGAGSRAIAVGYPERVNLAFDAESCEMKLLWKENFIDGSRHWTGRGQGFEPPLGEQILKLGAGASFHMGRLPSQSSTATTGKTRHSKPKFLGYDLDENLRPSFRYRIGEYAIIDTPIPNSTSDGSFTRKFSIQGPAGKLFYVAATGAKIEADAGMFLIDATWRTKITGNSSARIENFGESQALIIELELSSSGANFEQEYIW